MIPLKIGDGVSVPTKIRDVRPVFPEAARAAGQSGTVVMETVIDATGAVRDTRILRSNPPFDTAAAEAVRQWRFTPTIIDGVARPVIMTVTVSFSAQ
jgi:protein TonB